MNAALLAIVTAANLASFLAFQLLVIATLGAGSSSDAFFVGFTLPQLVSGMLVGATVNVLMPLFAQSSAPQRMIGTIIRKILWWSIPAAVVIVAAAPWITRGLFPGLDESASVLSALALQIQALAVPFMMANSIAFAFEYSAHRNMRVELATLSGSLVSIAIAYVCMPKFGVEAASAAVVARHIFPTLLLILPMLRKGQLVSGAGIPPEFWHSLRPLILSSAYYKSEILLDRFLSSFAAPGMISLFNLAQQINVAGSHVFNKTFANKMSVSMAQISTGDVSRKRREIIIGHLLLASGAFIAWIALMLSAESSVIALLVKFGNLENEPANDFFNLVFLLGGTLLGGMLGQVLAAQFYITQHTRLLAKIGVIGFTLGAVLKLAGFFMAGIYGLAVATSLYYLTNCAIIAAVLIFWRRLGLR